MAAEAEVRCALVGEHVTIDRSVHLMACRTAFNSGGFVLMKIRSALVRVALEASFLFESAQPFPEGGFMGIVARNTGQDAFLKAVFFIQVEPGRHIAMADAATFVRRCLQQ